MQAETRGVPRWIHVVFFISGFAALLYQIIWQRSLFAIYGINVESVTVVVTAFMLGLGIGSLTGGALSRRPDRPVLLLFAVIEAGIGAFGLVSLVLFREVGAATLHLPPLATGVITFLLVLVPTLLMGATLPLLVAHMVRASGHVGRSVGTLYGINTLGSALASAAAVLLALRFLGQTGSVCLAAALNLGIAVFVLSRRRAAEVPA